MEYAGSLVHSRTGRRTLRLSCRQVRSTNIVNKVTRAEIPRTRRKRPLPWSPSGTRIAFSAATRHTAGGNGYRLFSVDTARGGRLSWGRIGSPLPYRSPQPWAPDSSRIAYYEGTSFGCYRDHGVVIVAADGSKQADELGDWSSAVTWSPAVPARRRTFRRATSGSWRPMGQLRPGSPPLRSTDGRRTVRVVFSSFESTRPSAISSARSTGLLRAGSLWPETIQPGRSSAGSRTAIVAPAKAAVSASSSSARTARAGMP